jgi:uncharacterized protein
MAEVFINNLDVRLEGRYYQNENPNAPLALILHPDPQLGETMNNKVVYTLFQTFVKLGFSVLRFNFRGVGRSLGPVDEDENWELADAIIALDWLQNKNIDSKICWVAGVDSGAFVGMQLLMRRPELNGFVAVSPPAHQHDFSFLTPCPASGIIIQAGAVSAQREAQVCALAEKLNAARSIRVDYVLFPKSDSYYTNHLKMLYECLCEKVPVFLLKKQKKSGKGMKKVLKAIDA